MGSKPKEERVRASDGAPEEAGTLGAVEGFEYLDRLGIADEAAFALKGHARTPISDLIWGQIGIFSPAAECDGGDVACVTMKTGERHVGRVFFADSLHLCIVGDRPDWHVRTIGFDAVEEIAPLVEVRTPISHGSEREPTPADAVSRVTATRAACAGYAVFSKTGQDLTQIAPEQMLRRRNPRPLFRTARHNNAAGES